MSICCRTPIIASILTLMIVPIVNHNHVKGNTVRAAAIQHIGCIRTEPIPDGRTAKRLGVQGRICDDLILRVKRQAPKVCKNLKQAKRGRCVFRR